MMEQVIVGAWDIDVRTKDWPKEVNSAEEQLNKLIGASYKVFRIRHTGICPCRRTPRSIIRPPKREDGLFPAQNEGFLPVVPRAIDRAKSNNRKQSNAHRAHSKQLSSGALYTRRTPLLFHFNAFTLAAKGDHYGQLTT